MEVDSQGFCLSCGKNYCLDFDKISNTKQTCPSCFLQECEYEKVKLMRNYKNKIKLLAFFVLFSIAFISVVVGASIYYEVYFFMYSLFILLPAWIIFISNTKVFKAKNDICNINEKIRQINQFIRKDSLNEKEAVDIVNLS